MKTVQIYGHFENIREPKLIEVPENASVKQVLETVQQQFQPGLNVKELELYLEDQEQPLKKEEKAEPSGIKKKAHIHCHRCAKVQITVFYNGQDKPISFPPSATGKALLHKAIREFGISESDAGDYLLKLEDKTVLQSTDHIGSFVSYPHCAVKLFLTPTKPVQG